MGDVSIIPNSIEQGVMPKNNQPVVHFKFQLKRPVPNSLYQYITNEKIKSNEKTNLKEKSGKIISIQREISFNKELVNPIPFYEFYAAAGSFSEMQSSKNFKLIEGPENTNSNNYFACRIAGESMNRVIPNGSLCLFKEYSGGSRNGKIVLIENLDFQDPDFNSAFTIKTYSSEKSVTEETWGHESIILRPNSYDKSFQNIIITEQNAPNMRIVGEFVKILKE
jgi:SOS-response transcriptional repressor LexA